MLELKLCCWLKKIIGKSNTKWNHSNTIHRPHLSKEVIAEILSLPFNPCICITQQIFLNLPNLFPLQIFTPVGTIISLIAWPIKCLHVLPFCLWSSIWSSSHVSSIPSVLTSGIGQHRLHGRYFLALWMLFLIPTVWYFLDWMDLWLSVIKAVSCCLFPHLLNLAPGRMFQQTFWRDRKKQYPIKLMTLGYAIYKWMQAQTITQFSTEGLCTTLLCVFSSYKMCVYNFKKKIYYFHLTVIIPM